jgi:diguanylate cyclase (GGDEF)-like protein
VGTQGERLGSVVILTDITQRKAAEEQIEQLAFYDPLTRLPNRRLLLDRLRQVVEFCARSRRRGALLFLDLDNFKTLNDTLGHDIGDLLLQQVAQRLLDTVRARDTVARLGGDEFVVLLEDLGTRLEEAASQVQVVGEKLLAVLNQPFDLVGHRCHSTASIGIALIREPPATVDDLLKRADLAMYQAKASGRNALRFFDPAMQAVLEARTALEAHLREGLRKGQFLLWYQAQVDRAGRLTGAEALLRWHHPQRGLVAPHDFIPLAEETGLILPLGDWVLETACVQLAAWARRPETADLTLAVNVSARQFRHPGFVDQVAATLARQGTDPRRLKLELTESLLLQDVGDTIDKIAALKARGVGFALDDFGTGYSSLSYLKRLPLDQLKIDQSFVRDILTDPNDAVIARTIVALGQSLGLAVIAEGVETEGQRAFLLDHGCQAFQGYLFGRPGPVEALWDRRDTPIATD